jgi:hypothetical protein
VMARALHIHPNVLDFWLIAVYCEFDMRGSMEASRKILLQGIRRNENMSEFYFEYIKFELRVLKKLHTRKKLLETNQLMKGIEDVKEEEKQKEDKKISESVPSIVYSTSAQSITKKFRNNVSLHFRIKELVNNFTKEVDVSQLQNAIDEHILNVLYQESKADVMKYLINNLTTAKELEEKVDEFSKNTIPDLESFGVLISQLDKIEAEKKEKYEIALKMYNKISKLEDAGIEEESSEMFLNFIAKLESSEFELSSVHKTLYEKYPNNLSILTHYSKSHLLAPFDSSDVPFHRQLLASLNSCIKLKRNSKICKLKPLNRL